METQSDTTSRSRSLPAQATEPGQNGARSRHHSTQRGPGASASAGGPEPGTCRAKQGGPGLLSSSAIFRGAHRLSRRLSRPQPTRFGPGYQESAVSSNDHQLGDETLDRTHPIGPTASGLTLEPGTVF